MTYRQKQVSVKGSEIVPAVRVGWALHPSGAFLLRFEAKDKRVATIEIGGTAMIESIRMSLDALHPQILAAEIKRKSTD